MSYCGILHQTVLMFHLNHISLSVEDSRLKTVQYFIEELFDSVEDLLFFIEEFSPILVRRRVTILHEVQPFFIGELLHRRRAAPMSSLKYHRGRAAAPSKRFEFFIEKEQHSMNRETFLAFPLSQGSRTGASSKNSSSSISFHTS